MTNGVHTGFHGKPGVTLTVTGIFKYTQSKSRLSVKELDRIILNSDLSPNPPKQIYYKIQSMNAKLT